MSYPTYLIHFNKNHDKNGRFTSGDGDGDGILDDHHNYAKNKQAQSGNGGGGAGSLDQMIGDQIDEMVRKYNNPNKPVTYTTKKNKKKASKKSSRRATKKKATKNRQLASTIINNAKNVTADDALNTTKTSLMKIEDLLKEKEGLELAYLIKMLGR